MATETAPTEYHLPDKFSDMTIHFLYGIDEPMVEDTAEFLKENSFAFIADLVASGVPRENIEAAVNEGNVSYEHWPKKEPLTDFFWDKREETKQKLGELADKAVELCYGQDETQPIGGTFVTVGAELGSQQMALAGLIYGRHLGKLREVTALGSGAGPLYVVTDSFSDKMFGNLLPED